MPPQHPPSRRAAGSDNGTRASGIRPWAAGDKGSLRRERALWGILAAALFILGINKQMDLQTAMTETLRILARAGGWYNRRGAYQALFILALGIASLLAAGFLVYLTRRLPLGSKLSAAGAVLIVGFVLVRAASFHHFDRLINFRVLNLKMNWILEMGGILIVLAGVWIRLVLLGRARINTDLT